MNIYSKLKPSSSSAPVTFLCSAKWPEKLVHENFFGGTNYCENREMKFHYASLLAEEFLAEQRGHQEQGHQKTD